MSARSRTSTPPARRPSRTDFRDDGLNAQALDGNLGRRDVLTRPRCTDAYALLIFLTISIDLLRKLHSRCVDGDLHRVTHGIDFQGHVCGMNGSEASFLYWCRHNGTIRWDSPICVSACPAGGERVMCPVMHSRNDTDMATENGLARVITMVTTRMLAPQDADSTSQVHQYCVRKDFDPLAQLDIALGNRVSWSNHVVQTSMNIVSLLECPLLCTVLVTSAFLCGTTWLFLVRVSLWTYVSILLVALRLGLCSMGVCLLVGSPVLDPYLQAPQFCSAIHEALIAILSSLAAIVFTPELDLGAHSVDFGYTCVTAFDALALVSASCLLVLGLCSFSRPCYLHQREIGLAVHSIQEGCGMVFGAPLVLIIPLCEMCVRALVFLGSCCSLCILVSATEVHSNPITIFSTTFAGIPRSFALSAGLVIDILQVVFTFVWMQALTSAIVAYILSHGTAKVYFGCSQSTLQCVVRQFGSLTLGSLYDTCLCIPSLLSLGSGLEQRAYTDMAITSSPLAVAMRHSSDLLADRKLVSSSCNSIIGAILHISSFAFSLACGAAAHAIYTVIQNACRQEAFWEMLADSSLPPIAIWPIESLAKEIKEFDSALIAATVLGLGSYLIVQACTNVTKSLADAVIYCRMLDRQDGNPTNSVPETFRPVIDVQAFIDPISHDVMIDPVVAADGHSYERRSLENWMKLSDRSPLTNLPLVHTDFVPNHALRSQIEAFSRDGWM